MTTQVTTVNPHRKTTLVFRRFREKHTALNAVYWTSEFGRHSIRQVLATASPTEMAVAHAKPPFTVNMLPERAEELLARLDERAGTERLHILVICTANLESYLKDAIALHVATEGHRTSEYELDTVGEAIARPVIRSSTLPEMLEYIESLLDIDFGEDLVRWRTAYKLRCAAAHEGGIMSAKTAEKLGLSNKNIGEWLTLSWERLREILGSAHSIAVTINDRVSTGLLRSFEIEWTLAQWKREKRLPKQDMLWTVLHELGVKVSKSHKRSILEWLYK